MEFRNRQSIYLQIGDFICENILSGKWKDGDKIPSVRDMAVSIEVNPNTVMRSYSYLQENGIITNQRGIGYFVGGDSYENTLKLKKNEFVEKDLVRLFKYMELLGLTLEDIVVLYNKYKIREDRLP